MPLASQEKATRALVAAGVMSVRVASAEIHEASERLADAWRSLGAVVVLDRPRFLVDENGDHRPIVVALPPMPHGKCTTIVLLGARGLGFHVQVVGAAGDTDTKRMPSVAGALSIERCGESPPQRLSIGGDTGRGAIEVVVARSSRPLPSVRVILPERSGGALLPVLEPGALPVLAAPEKRANIAEARAKRDGATIAKRLTWTAAVDGRGSGEEILEPGCHTLQLFALDPGAGHPTWRGKLDLDAEMRDRSDEHVLDRDRTDAPDALLSTCVGEPTRVHIGFSGAPPRSPVLIAHAGWPLPDHLPTLWGSDAQGRFAHLLLARHVVSLPHEPIALAQGGAGVTPLPLSIQPGACYLAVALLVKEAARAVALQVRVGASDAFDERGLEGDGAVVAFCAGSGTDASATVEAHGTPLVGWGFALYRLQSSVWEPSL